MAVGVPRQHLDAPAVDLVAGVQELRVAHPVHGVHEALRLARDARDVLVGHAVRDPIVDEPLRVAVAPRVDTLLVVRAALQHRRAADGRNVGSTADVIGMHVRDDDPLEGRVELREHRLPALRGLRDAEARVDERPAVLGAEEVAVDVVEPERQREGRATDPFLYDVHW